MEGPAIAITGPMRVLSRNSTFRSRGLVRADENFASGDAFSIATLSSNATSIRLVDSPTLPPMRCTRFLDTKLLLSLRGVTYPVPSNNTPPLQIDQVHKTYRQGNSTVHALDGVNLTVQPGEFVAIMGASGSGKSTLLHAMAGLIQVDAGQVSIAGQDLSKLNDAALTKFRRKNLGIVFQAYNLIPALTAEENIRLPANETADLDDRVEHLLERLEMNERRSHRPMALSGGEQQRIAIARALVCDPAILLADEPTGSLDSATGTSICRLLRNLVDEERRSIVVVTHEPHVAMWADRVVVMKDGTDLTEFKTDGIRDPQTVASRYQQSLGAEAVH